MTIDDVTFFDRATLNDIDFLTNPELCIEPIAVLKRTINGKKYAAALPLFTRNVHVGYYKQSFLQRITRQPKEKVYENHFDFEDAVRRLLHEDN